jgi:hypothetical protein
VSKFPKSTLVPPTIIDDTKRPGGVLPSSGVVQGLGGALALEATHAFANAYARATSLIVEAARRDCDSFARFVLRSEKSGLPVKGMEIHKTWHDLLERQDRVVIWSHLEAGKTTQLAVARPVWLLGRNPNRRIVVVSNTSAQAKKIVRAISQYIEKSPQVRTVFPWLKRSQDKTLPWTTEAITVERRTIAKDPSVQGCGVHGNVMGSRIDDLVLDDILDFENTRTKHARDELYRWLKATLLGRLSENGNVWAIGNAWHPEDAMHTLAAEPRFYGYRYPVLDEETHESTCPDLWPLKRIEKTRDDLGPLEFSRQMLCRSRDDSSSRFKREWIDVGIVRGNGFSLVHNIDHLPAGYAVFHGVDLAVQLHAHADLTVIFTGLLHPDGSRQVLNVESGRWTGPDIVTRIDAIDKRYGGIFLVENVAAQQYIVAFANKLTRATVRPFTTGKNKADPAFGVESIAAEMAAGRWIIPSRAGKLAPEVDAWVSEMLYYDPSQHTGDRLMACWFMREAARRFERRLGNEEASGSGGVRVIGSESRAEARIAHLPINDADNPGAAAQEGGR